MHTLYGFLVTALAFALAIDPVLAGPAALLPVTGQTACYSVYNYEEVDCRGTGQDGETRTGLDWPRPRFEATGDQTVLDKLTGLAWTRDADPAGRYMTWQDALEYIGALNAQKHLGCSDWRLPNVNELESLVNKNQDLPAWLSGHGFLNIRIDYYWTSTTYAAYPAAAWSVSMYSGIVAGRNKTDPAFVWPVHGRSAGAIHLPMTGQTGCYGTTGAEVACSGTGQDGASRTGVDRPDRRFRSNADGTVTDGLTGLVWSMEGDAPGPASCSPAVPRSWQEALQYIQCLNSSTYLGRSDWRLPNRNELASLADRGQPNSAAWLNSRGFVRVQAAGYWSSSTYPYNTWNAWSVNMHDGAITSYAKNHRIHVWPVRGGQLKPRPVGARPDRGKEDPHE